MTVLVRDNFDGSAGTELPDHTPDVDLVGGGWRIDRGAAADFTLDGSGECDVAAVGGLGSQATIDPGQSNYKITGHVTNTTEAFIRLFFRAIDQDNFWTLDLERQPLFGSMLLSKTVGGSGTNVANVQTGITGASSFDFEIVVSASSITVRDLTNGFSLFANDDTFQTATRAGFGDRDSSGDWKVDYQIESLPALPPPTCDVQIEVLEFEAPDDVPDFETIQYTHPNLAGIVPKGVIIHHVRVGDDGLESEEAAVWGIGACDEDIAQWGQSWAAADGSTLTSTYFQREARLIGFPDRAADCSPRTVGEARVDFFIPGGFQLTWFDGTLGDWDPGRVKLFAIIFAGQDVMTKVDIFDMDTGRGLDEIGFLPDGILAIAPSKDAPDPQCEQGIHGSVGFADLQTVNNVAYVHAGSSGDPTSEYHEEVRGAASAVSKTLGPPTIAYTIDYTDPGNPDNLIGMGANVSAANSDEAAYFAFRAAGVDVRAGIVDSPAGTGPWNVTDPGFEPQAVIVIPNLLRSLEGQQRRTGLFGMGVFTDDDQAAHWVNYEDDDAAPIARSGSQTKALYLQDRTDPVLALDASFTSFNPNGWTLEVDALSAPSYADNPPYKWPYLAIGSCPAEAVVTPAEEDDCRTDVWLSDSSEGDDPPPNAIADIVTAIGRFQVDPTLDAIYDFTTDDLNGKTPKAALFFANWTEATSGQETVPDAMLSVGAASKSPGGAIRRWAQGGMSEDNADPPDLARAEWLAKVISEPFRSGGSVHDGVADILDFIPGGVRLQTVDRAFSTALNVVVVFFAGDDLEAYAWHWQQQANPDGELLGGLGFQPDLLITIKGVDDLEVRGSQGGGSLLGLGGVNLRDDENELGFFGQTLNDGGAATSGAAALNPTKTGLFATTSLGGRQIRKTLAQNAFGDGFETVESDSDSTGFLALRLPGTPVWADVIDPPQATGIWAPTDPGFTPQFVMLEQTIMDQVGDDDADVAIDGRASTIGVGVFTPEEQQAVAFNSEIGSSFPDAESNIDDNPVYLRDDVGTEIFRATFLGMSILGWRLNFSVADATQRKWFGWAIGEPGPLP